MDYDFKHSMSDEYADINFFKVTVGAVFCQVRTYIHVVIGHLMVDLICHNNVSILKQL